MLMQLASGCQTYGPRAKCDPYKDFVTQCECQVSEVGLRKLRQNGRGVMADADEKDDDLFF